MTRRRLMAIGAVCLAVALIVTLKALKGARDHHFQQMAETYRQQAMKEASASTTAADAKAWLERNGFDVALYNDNVASERTRQTSQGQEKLNFVSGYRKVSDAVGGRWMESVFLFQATEEPFVPGAFVRVEVDDDSPPSKAWRTEFARRAATARATTLERQ